jgi:hypothetical protein
MQNSIQKMVIGSEQNNRYFESDLISDLGMLF